MNGLRRDAADWLLAGAVRMMPAGRREWGQAMRAELGAVSSVRARWGFTLGCLRAVATQPVVLRRAGHPLLLAGVLLAILAWSGTVDYAPLRWGLVGLVAVLVAVSWLGHRPGILGPVGGNRPARLLRAGGYLLVGVMAAGFVTSMASHDNPGEQARNGVPIFTVLLASYLIGFLAVTARRTAATPRVLTAGAGAGVTAAVLWVATALVFPPMPASVGPAFVLTVAAMTAAAMTVTAPGNARQRGGTSPAMLAALCAGTVGALLIFTLVVLLSSYGPASLIPDLAPAALTPADDLAQSRVEIQDPYVAMLFLACLVAIALGIASIATGRRAPLAPDRPAATTR